ncbi:MAG: hypothetical protein FWH11_09335 [Micrococcales bacterium]|nr:hypothetical protein [Micrococcales bacterium]
MNQNHPGSVLMPWVRRLVVGPAAVLVLGLGACQDGGSSAPAPPTTPGTVETTPGDALFAQMPAGFGLESGAGGWSDTIELDQDGSFTFHSERYSRAETGPDYPDGTLYESWSTGRFEVVRQVGDLEYELTVVALDQRGTPGERIDDGVRVVTPEPTDYAPGWSFTVYLPGTEVSDLPEGVQSWSPLQLDSATDGSTLTRWCLYDTGLEAPYWQSD